MLDWFRTWFGMTITAFAALDDAGQQALAADLIALASSRRGTGNTVVALCRRYQFGGDQTARPLAPEAGRSKRTSQ
jgi:hypothetical protein